MTEEQKFLFALLGYLAVEQVLPSDESAEIMPPLGPPVDGGRISALPPRLLSPVHGG